MNFNKDLLIVDLEATGLEMDRHEIIQIAAVLLDKQDLKEKANFVSFVKPSAWHRRDKESMEINGIKWEQLQDAPDLRTVLTKFNKKFKPKSVTLSYYGGPLDIDFLRNAYRRQRIPWQFDYHYFNLWGVFYAFLAKQGKLNNKKKFAGFSLEDLMKMFNINSNSRHDALEDCRIEAEVLRKILK